MTDVVHPSVDHVITRTLDDKEAMARRRRLEDRQPKPTGRRSQSTRTALNRARARQQRHATQPSTVEFQQVLRVD